MPTIDAYCDNCHRWTALTNDLANVANMGGITFQNVSTPCKHCGHAARVIDGTYSVINGAIHIVKSLNLSKADLKALSHILQNAIQNNLSATEVRAIISKDVPKATPLGRYMKEGNNFVAHLSLFATLIGLWLAFYLSSPPIDENKIADKVFERLTQQERSTKKPVTPPATAPKMGVNEPCYCGSGRKFKKCHASVRTPIAPQNTRKHPK